MIDWFALFKLGFYSYYDSYACFIICFNKILKVIVHVKDSIPNNYYKGIIFFIMRFY